MNLTCNVKEIFENFYEASFKLEKNGKEILLPTHLKDKVLFSKSDRLIESVAKFVYSGPYKGPKPILIFN